MSPTPQITMRVSKEKLAEWKDVCRKAGTNVSAKIRELMDDWVDGHRD